MPIALRAMGSDRITVTPHSKPSATRAPHVRRGWRALHAALALCLALQVIGARTDTNWLWGLDSLRFWGLPGALALVALGASGFLPGVGSAIERALDRIAARWLQGGAKADLIASLAVTAILFSLRDTLRFTGDFDLRVGFITHYKTPAWRLFPQAYPLDLLANAYLPRLLTLRGIDAATALQSIGALMGGIFTWVALAFLRALGARGAAFPAALAALLGGGYLLHFAGYDKFGPLLLGVTVAGLGIVRLSRKQGGAWALCLGCLLCVYSHRTGYLVLPAAGLAYVHAFRGGPAGAARRNLLLAAGVAALGALAHAPRTLDLLLHYDLATHLPGGRSEDRPSVPGAWGALLRLSDVLNVLFYLVPLWPVGAVAGWLTRKSNAGAPAGRDSTSPSAGRFSPSSVAALAVGAELLALFATRTSQGAGRDWDVGVAAGLTVALVVAYALVKAWKRMGAGSGVAPAFTLALAGSIALWGIHASEPMGLRRAQALLTAEPTWGSVARSHARDFLGVRALNGGDYEEAAHQFEHAISIAPNPRFFYQVGLAYLGAGRFDSAEVAFTRAARLTPRVASPWVLLGELALARGDTARARTMVDSALVRDPRNGKALALLKRLSTAAR